jgi:hypothetical protein
MAIALRQQVFKFFTGSPEAVTLPAPPLSGSLLYLLVATADHDNATCATPAGWTAVTGEFHVDGIGGAGSRAFVFEKVSAGAADQTTNITNGLCRGFTILEFSAAGARQAAPTMLQDESATTANMTPGPVTPNAGGEALIVTGGVYFQAFRASALAGSVQDENRDNLGVAPPVPPAAGANPAFFVSHRIVPNASGSYNVGSQNDQGVTKFSVATVIYSGAAGIRGPVGADLGGGVI